MTRKFAPYTRDLNEKQVTESTTSPANRRRTNISFLNEKIVHCFLKQRFFQFLCCCIEEIHVHNTWRIHV